MASSIGQEADTKQVTGGGAASFKPVDYFDDRVRQGYDRRDSQSRNTAKEDAKLQTQHRLSQPRLASGSVETSAIKTVLAAGNVTQVQPEDVANINWDVIAAKGYRIPEHTRGIQAALQLNTVFGEHSTEKLGDVLKLAYGPSPNMRVKEAWVWAEKNLPADTFRALQQMIGGDSIKVGKDGKIQLPEKLDFFGATTLIHALKGEPKELVNEMKADYQKMARMMALGNNLWDTDVLTTLLASIREKMQDNRLKFDQENIKIAQVEKDRISKKIVGDLREQIKKSEEAKNASFISKIFGWIGLAIMAIVTAIVVATGVGAVAGGFMMAALALTATMMIDQETGGHITKGLAKAIMKLAGVDEQTASYIAMGILLALTIALSLGASASGGAAVASSRIANIASRVGLVADGATSVAEGSAKVAVGVYSYEGSMLGADVKENKGKLMRLQQLMEDALDSITKAMDEIAQTDRNIAAMMASNDETKKHIARNIRN